MENKRGAIRVALYENLRDLMTRHLFEKITIKQICDATGVIRATFYNHFDDKYDCLNAIVYHDIVETLADLNNENTDRKLVELFEHIGSERAFYRAAYMVTGQNSFESMIHENFRIAFHDHFSGNRITEIPSDYPEELLDAFYANSMAFMVYYFVMDKNQPTPEETVKTLKGLLGHTVSVFSETGTINRN